MSRLFLALEMPDEVRDELDAAVEPLRRRHEGLRWTPPPQWHVTLAFVGEADVPADDVLEAVTGAAAGAPATIRLHLTEPGRFGDRVLWYGVRDHPEGAVADLGASVQSALVEAGLPVDEKPVRAHVTLARSRGRSRGRVRSGTVVEVPTVRGSWTVDDVVLYDSVPGGHGEPNRYDPRGRLPLGG